VNRNNPTAVFDRHLHDVEKKLEDARAAVHRYHEGGADELTVLNSFSDARKAMDRILLDILEK
jgi:predicted urease superfamily metal-dependent hydrolase